KRPACVQVAVVPSFTLASSDRAEHRPAVQSPFQSHAIACPGRMDCFADFCLSCDRQTNGTPFCSQACRLAELDHSSPSQPTSPSDSYSERESRRSPPPPPPPRRPAFYLPPAFDFSLHRTSTLPR